MYQYSAVLPELLLWHTPPDEHKIEEDDPHRSHRLESNGYNQ